MFAARVHLAEVGVARDSGEVAEEDEKEELAVEKRRQPDGSAVRPQEGEVGSRIAGGHFLTFPSVRVYGTGSSPFPVGRWIRRSISRSSLVVATVGSGRTPKLNIN